MDPFEQMCVTFQVEAPGFAEQVREQFPLHLLSPLHFNRLPFYVQEHYINSDQDVPHEIWLAYLSRAGVIHAWNVFCNKCKPTANQQIVGRESGVEVGIAETGILQAREQPEMISNEQQFTFINKQEQAALIQFMVDNWTPNYSKVLMQIYDYTDPLSIEFFQQLMIKMRNGIKPGLHKIIAHVMKKNPAPELIKPWANLFPNINKWDDFVAYPPTDFNFLALLSHYPPVVNKLQRHFEYAIREGLSGRAGQWIDELCTDHLQAATKPIAFNHPLHITQKSIKRIWKLSRLAIIDVSRFWVYMTPCDDLEAEEQMQEFFRTVRWTEEPDARQRLAVTLMKIACNPVYFHKMYPAFADIE